MENLKEQLISDIENFREVGHKFLSGEVNRNNFKKTSGGMGVYAHRSGTEFMVRLRTFSGVISIDKLQLIYDFASKYNLGGIHLTTRQAIQLHGLGIDEICEIMLKGLDEEIYTRGAGGNFPRNVALSPLSGVDPEEAFDVTPYAIKVNEHFVSKIRSYKLPRKLKVAFASSNADEAHTTVTDLGFLAVKENNKECFKLYIGGGIGRNPRLAVPFDELVEPKDVLYHVEAITNLFIAEGDYENHGKARIRYIVERMGAEQFIECYKKHLAQVKETQNLELDLVTKEVIKQGIETDLNSPRLFKQKQEGLYSVYFHPIGGQLKLSVLKMLLDELKSIDETEVRLTMNEGLYIRNLNGKEAERLIKLTKALGGETRLEQSVACIGVPTCQIGILNGQKTLQEIIAKFKEEGLTEDILPKVHISGCPNSCGVHEIGIIGFQGKLKRVNNESKNVFELYVKGALGEGVTRLGDSYGDILQDEVPQFLFELAKIIKEEKLEFINWLEKNEESFKQLVAKFAV
jgi:ferredoxin-nitrite reductase